jgi:hypothetical protein
LIDIGALATGLTFARDAFQVMLGSKIEIETQTRILEALTKLGAAQDTLFQVREELFRLQGENDRLRQELAARNDWETQKAKYHLTTTAGGGQVRFSDGPPPHYACPACFSNKIIHILQDLGTMGGGFQCPGCKSIFKVNPRRDR